MHRNGERQGRGRNKGSNKKRTRDGSADPKYKSKNYNKPHRQSGVTPFTFVRTCKFANRVYRQKEAILILKEGLQQS